MSTMGDRIRIKRLEQKLSMEELGDKLGVRKSAVNKWEHGDVQYIKRSTIEKMARLFEVSPSWLMGFDDASDVSLTYSAPGKDILITKADARPILGPTSLRALLYQAALAVKDENLEVAINLLKSLS